MGVLRSLSPSASDHLVLHFDWLRVRAFDQSESSFFLHAPVFNFDGHEANIREQDKREKRTEVRDKGTKESERHWNKERERNVKKKETKRKKMLRRNKSNGLRVNVTERGRGRERESVCVCVCVWGLWTMLRQGLKLALS